MFNSHTSTEWTEGDLKRLAGGQCTVELGGLSNTQPSGGLRMRPRTQCRQVRT